MLMIGNGRLVTRDDQAPFFEHGSVVLDGNVVKKAGEEAELKKEFPDAEYVDANLLALSRSLFPSFLDMILPAPCPNINPKACRMAIRLNTTPTAPLALVPKRLTKYVSAVL